MSESSPCCHGVPPVSHPDGCELVVKNAVKVVNAIADVGGDKTTVHDNTLVGCLADGCHHHGTSFFPCICQCDIPSNVQLCQSSIDDHQCQMLGMSPCASMVERTVQINVAMIFKDRKPGATAEINAFIDCLDAIGMKEVCDSTPKLAQQEGICSTCMQQDGCKCQQ